MAWKGAGRCPRCTAPRTPDTTVPLSGEKTQEPRAEQVRMGGTRRGSTVVHGLASRRGMRPWHAVYEGTWVASCEERAWLQGERHTRGRYTRWREARSGGAQTRVLRTVP